MLFHVPYNSGEKDTSPFLQATIRRVISAGANWMTVKEPWEPSFCPWIEGSFAPDTPQSRNPCNNIHGGEVSGSLSTHVLVGLLTFAGNFHLIP